MQHKLAPTDLVGYSFANDFASSFGKGSAKRLTARVMPFTRTITYIVKDHGKTKYSGPDFDLAVLAYNEAP